jgi:hypothetical protein
VPIRWREDEADGEIDAVAEPYAIQHTSVDSLPVGRLADVRFKQVVGNLEQDLAGKLGFPLWITWDWGAIQKGQIWPAVCKTLYAWIANEAAHLSDGRHRVTNVSGVPFTFDVLNRGRIKFDGVRFARYDPGDTTLAARLSE